MNQENKKQLFLTITAFEEFWNITKPMLPAGLTRTLVGIVEKGSRSIGLKPPVTREMIDKYTEDIAVDGNRYQKELGFISQYDLKTGLEETIKEIRESGTR